MNRTKRRNLDTSNANLKRAKNADEFALMIVDELDEIQRLNNYEFKGLNDRVVALNHMGIKTRRGCEWSNNSVKRVLERVIKGLT
jgi:hypothetical protein